VSGVCFRSDGRVLLQRRTDNGLWGLPGGAVEYGESVTTALRREVREETGFEVEVGRLIGVYSDPAHHQIITYPDGNVVHFVSLCFECMPASGVLALSDETSAAAWFPPTALPAEFQLVHRIRIADALTRAATPFIR
jgi:ADP-ribose pyrophosphatase YjhB (NUDIX family)